MGSWGSLFLACLFILLSCREEKKDGPVIYFTGDILLDRGVRKVIERKGADYLFEGVKDIFRDADFVIGNLECPATNIHRPIFKKYVFRAEPQWLESLKKTGFTHLALANNHSYDQGREGLEDTRANILKYGMIPLGYGKDHDEACSPLIMEVKGMKLALFSSVQLRLEGWPFMEDSSGICMAGTEELCERIRSFKKVNPAIPVLVSLHWGTEHITKPSPDQVQHARMMIDAGADIIIGHHPHVIQGMEIYKGRKIWYSLGNFIFDQEKPVNSRAWVLRITLSDPGPESDSIPVLIQDCVPEAR